MTPLTLSGVNLLDHGFHVAHRRLRDEAVTQIEDVPRPSLRFVENGVDLRFEHIEWGQEGQRIQVTLDGPVVSDPLPGVAQPLQRL